MNLSSVCNSSLIVRFIFFPRHIRKNQSVRWQAFEPMNGETSVTIRDSLTEQRLHEIGQQIETQKRSRNKIIKLVGNAQLTANTIRKNKVDVVAAPSCNNPQHANIINWPEAKDEQMMICKELVLSSKYTKY